MSFTPGISSRDLGSPPARQPLQVRTTSPSLTQTPKQVRRKNSFIRCADSSEDVPSPHESIFEAFYFSAANSDESSSRIELITLYPNGAMNDENRGPGTPPTPNPLDDVQFRYGHGTVLEPISEQRTGKTNRTMPRTKSLDDMPSFPFLKHRDSFAFARTPRRKLSFSLDDTALINRYYHDACVTIEKESCRSLPVIVSEIYAQPKKPQHPPPDRPPTPPGMPSWTAAQNMPQRGRVEAPRQSRFWRFFGFPASGLTVSSRIPTSNGQLRARDRVTSAPVRGRTAPRFRPPRSVYGPLDQHPFSRAPVAVIATGTPTVEPEPSMAEVRRQKSKLKRQSGNRVRFTPSATARDSENIALTSAFESTTTNAVHPLTPLQVLLQPELAPIAKPCKHQVNRLAKKKPERVEGFSTPPSINYANLSISSRDGRPLTPSMGPRQSLSPALSRVTVGSRVSFGSDSPYLRNVIDGDEIDIAPTPEQDSRVSSSHSAAPLMSGALRQSLIFTQDAERPPQACVEDGAKPDWCWRCKVDHGYEMLGKVWVSSLGFFGLFCCGYLAEEEEEVGDQSFGQSARGGEMVGPRRIVLGEVQGMA